MKRKHQVITAIVEFRNGEAGVRKFTSNGPICFEDVVDYLEKEEGFDGEDDSITIIEEISETNIGLRS